MYMYAVSMDGRTPLLHLVVHTYDLSRLTYLSMFLEPIDERTNYLLACCLEHLLVGPHSSSPRHDA